MPVFLLLLLCLLGGVRAEPSAVGQVAFKLGEAWIVGADGARRPAATEAAVRPGDALETAASGHLHIRFRDGGLVAVRPNSRLVIEDYGDPAAGGVVRFRLERGTARSITGRFGEADRNRFRLNTPIAAIGIAGTDFIVEGAADLTRVAVNSGGIVAAPFDAGCRPEDDGPCGGPFARRLTAEMGELMIEIRRGSPAPSLVPRQGLAAAEDARRAAEAAPKAEVLTQALADKALPPLPATLVWGRWAHAPAWEGDILAVPREEAAAGRERVAENARYVLYRLPQSAVLPTAGSVSFRLDAAQAHLVQAAGVQPAQVLDGRLALDFAARRFSTALTLESQPTGRMPFAADGPLAADGSFVLIEWLSRVKGAYGLGGSGPTAAYLFERATPQGMLMGITQWR